jgi:hypothetical protein
MRANKDEFRSVGEFMRMYAALRFLRRRLDRLRSVNCGPGPL